MPSFSSTIKQDHSILVLNDVTICAIDCVTPILALRALNKSLALVNFQEALLFTDSVLESETGVQTVKIDKLDSLEAYSKFLMKELYQFIDTPYVLIVQWDGFVIDSSAWRPEFLNFDYVGAKWPWHQDGKNVGNGGFSLRSKKLLEASASPDITFIEDMPEDDQICRVYRYGLENKFGIKFSPENIADHFSYERSLPDESTFGFHGIFNIWRYLDDSEVELYADAFPDTMYSSLGFYEFFLQYFLLRKFKPMYMLYQKLSAKRSQEEIFSNVLKITNDDKFTNLFLEMCNKSMARSPYI